MKLLPLVLLACALPGAAQSLHKCTLDGKVTYSQTPCERGDATTIAVPDAPRPDPAAAAELKTPAIRPTTKKSASHAKSAYR